MKSLLADVGAFHRACGVPVLPSPQTPAPDRVALRKELIEEEVNRELLPAMDQGNLPEIADAMVDSIYVIVGAALEYGIPLERVWEAVQSANMAKVDPVTGKVRKRPDGKVLKPDGWKPPDIAAVLVAATEAPNDPDTGHATWRLKWISDRTGKRGVGGLYTKRAGEDEVKRMNAALPEIHHYLVIEES